MRLGCDAWHYIVYLFFLCVFQSVLVYYYEFFSIIMGQCRSMPPSSQLVLVTHHYHTVAEWMQFIYSRWRSSVHVIWRNAVTVSDRLQHWNWTHASNQSPTTMSHRYHHHQHQLVWLTADAASIPVSLGPLISSWFLACRLSVKHWNKLLTWHWTLSAPPTRLVAFP